MIAHAASRFPARIWMRVDALEPLTCSVRFAMTMGFGRLTWGGADSRDIQPAVVAGTAAGLTAADLSALSLAVGHACSDAQQVWPLGLRRLPSQGRSRVGEWVEIDVTTDNIDESTDIVAAFGLDGVESPADGVVHPGGSPKDTFGAAVPVAESTRASPQSFGRTETHPGPSPAATGVRSLRPPEPPRSELVRSLVRRIREQDEALKALRHEVAALRSQLGLVAD